MIELERARREKGLEACWKPSWYDFVQSLNQPSAFSTSSIQPFRESATTAPGSVYASATPHNPRLERRGTVIAVVVHFLS